MCASCGGARCGADASADAFGFRSREPICGAESAGCICWCVCFGNGGCSGTIVWFWHGRDGFGYACSERRDFCSGFCGGYARETERDIGFEDHGAGWNAYSAGAA